MSLADVQAGAPAPAAAAAPVSPAPPAPVGQAPAAPAAAGEAKPATAEKGEDQRAVQRIATLSREKRAIEEKYSGAEQRARLSEADAKAFAELKAIAPKDPRRVIKELGLTFEQLVDAFAGEAAPAAKDPITEVERLRQEIEEKERAKDAARLKSEAEATQAELDQARGASARNLEAQIAADKTRWEVLGRVENVGRQAVDAIETVMTRAAKAGQPLEGQALSDFILEYLDGLEAEYVTLGERYRKGAKASADASQSDGTGQRRSLAERQSERQPPKTIDPSAPEGGILQRAQAGESDTSREAVLRRVKAALKASGSNILQR